MANHNMSRIRLTRRLTLTLLAAFAAGGARPHDFKAGDLVIDHPYAVPTVDGARTGAVYFRTLRNNGRLPDQSRQLAVRTAYRRGESWHW